MLLRSNIRHLFFIAGLLAVFIVACGDDAPSAAPTVAATPVPPTAVVVAVTPASVSPTTTPIPDEFVEGDPAVVVFQVTDRPT